MEPKLIMKPLTKEEILAIRDDGKFITVIVSVGFCEAVSSSDDKTIDNFNDKVENIILGETNNILDEISYKPVGVDKDNVLVQVRAKCLLNDEDDDDEDIYTDDISKTGWPKTDE